MRRRAFWPRTLMIAGSILFLAFLYLPAYSQMNGVAIGYGLGNLNPHDNFGKIPYDRGHEFLYLSYSRGFRLTENGQFVIEPFASYIFRSESGIDLGLNLLFRYHLWNSESRKHSFFFTLGTGGVLTTVDFSDQGSTALFILQGGVGFKFDRYFIEFRHRHYSNGGTASPNVGVETEFLSVGFYF